MSPRSLLISPDLRLHVEATLPGLPADEANRSEPSSQTQQGSSLYAQSSLPCIGKATPGLAFGASERVECLLQPSQRCVSEPGPLSVKPDK